jgi:hypothetical protein
MKILIVARGTSALLAAAAASVIAVASMGVTASNAPDAALSELRAAADSRRMADARNTAALPRQVPGYPYHAYDGRFIFVRLYFEQTLGSEVSGNGRGRGFGGSCAREACWHHDYPKSDRALTAILAEITGLRSIVASEGNVLRVDDPNLSKFPIAYLCEPGHWSPNQKEVAALHAYLMKGGFIIFDDFGPQDWANFTAQMEKVLPGLKPLPLDGSEPVFHTFFDIGPEGLNMQSYRGVPQFFGFFEDNDKTKRQIAIVDFNNDIGEFMEYSGTGFYPVDESNEAFKIGVDFIIYAVTH